MLCGFLGFKGPGETYELNARTIAYFKSNSPQFAASVHKLNTAVDNLNADPGTLTAAKTSLLKCRIEYKKLQFILEYFFPPQAIFYNAPAKVEVEDPFIEYDEPRGLQVIEAMLFDADPAAKKEDLLEQIRLISTTADDMPALMYNFKATDRQILESLRLELVRVIALTITGYDAPSLKSGMREAFTSLSAAKYILNPLLKPEYKEAGNLSSYLNRSLGLLESNSDFDSFDRMKFLKSAALPLQQHLGIFIRQNGLELNTVKALNYNAENLFSADALRASAFSSSGHKLDSEMVSLGKALFFEKGISGDGKRSCATCHQAEKYFTDALPKSIAVDGHSRLSRNAPSVLYSVFQKKQFWDGRAESLEAQIKDVLLNQAEMNSTPARLVENLKTNVSLNKQIRKSFPDSALSHGLISTAIASYLETLNPFSSPFDKYINGSSTAMTKEQIHGFNLFMGKAQCATCHFAPIFNGLIPPLYQRSEFEVLGTTATDDLANPKPDNDLGRYNILKAEPYQRAFKTPTVRNAARTAPYMHNGAFANLDSVMVFYNKGGGNGFGLHVTNQTLSPNPLNLTNGEIKDIISFIDALTDESPERNLH